ncbi:MAG: hypothetical protein GF411_10870 [Candidatus Lokiarchaeota archaeon]|nr:hypothetical protein [Candidatus Lokiarchaeota archaeon]
MHIVSEKNGVQSEEKKNRIEIIFFKSDTCAFCPRAEEVLYETIDDFERSTFKVTTINVSENPEAAEEYGVFALPTILIGGVSVTGIPEPGMIFKMILGAKARQRRGAK